MSQSTDRHSEQTLSAPLSDAIPAAQAALDAVVQWFEHLTPATVQDLSKYYAADARFKDPFNDVTGVPAIEAIFVALALHHRIAPPTINIENLDDAIHLNIVRDKPRALPSGDIAALNNSFGFGGHNVAIAFRSI